MALPFSHTSPLACRRAARAAALELLHDRALALWQAAADAGLAPVTGGLLVIPDDRFLASCGEVVRIRTKTKGRR